MDLPFGFGLETPGSAILLTCRTNFELLAEVFLKCLSTVFSVGLGGLNRLFQESLLRQRGSFLHDGSAQKACVSITFTSSLDSQSHIIQNG
ncbi:hypothetical protein CEXT_149261 [Caerostris extrusa]|uniref:Uncharacterized protein n=1 Tax=Caerostris extrusa TaxID=172846 RepID=A0AAV4U7F3_CAEEX|nr:hypothetical protein CEXT_149261 [Caerostris extrusa]